jgi:hypothetical protein
MKKGIVHAALCALALAAPAAAERFYVPVLGTTAADGSTLATKVWVAGAAGVERQVAGRAGLLAVDADSVGDVTALMVGRGDEGRAEVPVFSAEEAYMAGTEVPLDGLPRPRAMASLLVGAANLSARTASCKAALFDRNGGLLAEIRFEIDPMSLAREDALAKAGRGRVDAVNVTCDQSFYPFAVAADRSGLTPVFAKGIGPNGACGISLMLVKQSNGHYITSQPGLFHDATKASPKGIICIKAPGELKVAKAIYEWDVTVGPWSSRDKSGLHNVAYFFLNRYRGGVVGNINVAGPNKNILKAMQNVGMARGTNTNNKVGYETQVGLTYHYIWTYDAANKVATLQALVGGVEVKRFVVECRPGNNQTLIIKPYSKAASPAGEGLAMVAEFGNYVGQHHPEEATIGWKYHNFKVDLSMK